MEVISTLEIFKRSITYSHTNNNRLHSVLVARSLWLLEMFTCFKKSSSLVFRVVIFLFDDWL